MQRRQLLTCLLSAATLSALSTLARAADDLVVIVHKDNPHIVDRAYVARIYTGATKGWPDGSPVFPLDQTDNSEIREQFYVTIVGRSLATMRAVWAQNIFSGKGLPPKIAAPDAEMRRIVASNLHAIGYIRASAVDDCVNVIARVAPQ